MTDLPLSPADVDAVRAGYAFDAPALELGALVNGDAMADVPINAAIRIPYISLRLSCCGGVCQLFVASG